MKNLFQDFNRFRQGNNLKRTPTNKIINSYKVIIKNKIGYSVPLLLKLQTNNRQKLDSNKNKDTMDDPTKFLTK